MAMSTDCVRLVVEIITCDYYLREKDFYKYIILFLYLEFCGYKINEHVDQLNCKVWIRVCRYRKNSVVAQWFEDLPVPLSFELRK